MKRISVLVDYTDGCRVSLRQAEVIAQKTGGTITAVHLLRSGEPAGEASSRLRDYCGAILAGSVKCETLVGEGDVLEAAAAVVGRTAPDLVVLCTHGIRGLAQRLFGAHVLKLVQALPFPCLVVQENTQVRHDGFRKVLLPASPFPDFAEKLRQSTALARVSGSEIVLYEIDKYVGNSDDRVKQNLNEAETYLRVHEIPFSRVLEDTTVVSLGFSRQTLAYARANDVDVISMMSNIQDHDLVMLKSDKEQMLTNSEGIPVLSCCPV